MFKEAALALSILFFPVACHTQTPPPPAAEYNLTMCSSAGIYAFHFELSQDKKVLAVTYLRDGNSAVRDDTLAFNVDKYEEQENKFVKIHGTALINSNEKFEFTGESFGTRIAGMIAIDGKVHTVVYGYVGKLDDLVKLDGKEEGKTCKAFLATGSVEALPAAIVNWLKFGKVDAPDDSNATKS
jgi:hypothetical protein